MSIWCVIYSSAHQTFDLHVCVDAQSFRGCDHG